MIRRSSNALWLASWLAVLTCGGSLSAADDAAGPPQGLPPTVGAETGDKPDAKPEEPKTVSIAKPSPLGHETILKDAKTFSGLLTFHRRDQKLYAELMSGDYSREYLVLISIARGIGFGRLLGGMTWGFGDDWVWQFRKIGEDVHIVRKNVRFKADQGSPEASAVRYAYTDSVLFSLPILTKGPKGGDLVDLTPVFMSDLPQISFALPGFAFSSNKSTWDAIKAFPNNMELQVAATYQSSGQLNLDTVPDSRGATIVVHYSLSQISSTGYRPRRADDRVGYFLTVVKDFSQQGDDDQFVRYINRWRLDKADSGAALSAPKEPIVFWIEKTVPFRYRKPVRDGILEWNRAFEKAGFVEAIEVRQQPEDADWDPEDVNYNTFRWITSEAGFAMGPSRVNPYTGQILDADIIFDADFVEYWKEQFETLTKEGMAAMLDGDVPGSAAEAAGLGSGAAMFGLRSPWNACLLNRGMAPQMALGAAAIAVLAEPSKTAELEEKLLMQALKEVTMHEVGHTLGLRHNFKGSTWKNLKEVHDAVKTGSEGMVASVMDYIPANLAVPGQSQGDYYPTTLGPYDHWAIEYGYRQFSANEDEELKKLAARSGEPALRYATDEDTTGSDPDPESNRFDLGADPLEYARQRAELMKQLIPGLTERLVKPGEDYTKARKAFNVILAQYGQAAYFASRYVGGLLTSRSHKGDKDARPPISLIDPKRQRDALTLIENEVLSEKPFQFPPELYNQLGPTNWNHWGLPAPPRKDIAVHEVILACQTRVLNHLLSPTTLGRIHDAELKLPADKDTLTAAELIQRLTRSVFSELETIKEGSFTDRKPAIGSLRRNLQRAYLKQLSQLALGRSGAPEDCQTVAHAELADLKVRMDKLLGSEVKLDGYTRAHLQESASRIAKVLDAELSLPGP